MLVCYVHENHPDHLPQTTVHLAIDSEVVHVGRGEHAHISPDDESLSRRHARLFVRGTRVFVEDEGSSNGTWIEGERLVPGHPVELGAHTRVELTGGVWAWAWWFGGMEASPSDRAHALSRLAHGLDASDRRVLDSPAREALIELAAPLALRQFEFSEAEVGSLVTFPTHPGVHELWSMLPARVRAWCDRAQEAQMNTSTLFGEVRALEACAGMDRVESLLRLARALSPVDLHALGLECSVAMGHIVRLASQDWRDEPRRSARYSSVDFPDSHEYVLSWFAEQALIHRRCVGEEPVRGVMRYGGGLVATLPHTLLTAQEQEEHRPSGGSYGPYKSQEYYLVRALYDSSGVPRDDWDGREKEETRGALEEAMRAGALHVVFR